MSEGRDLFCWAGGIRAFMYVRQMGIEGGDAEIIVFSETVSFREGMCVCDEKLD